MSDLPKPPSTYILSELHDVTLPPSVSWYPQTIGWKILAVVALLAGLYLVYRWLRKWWINRYRAEALDAVAQLDPNDSSMPQTLFSILKTVLIHIDSHNAKLFDEAFLSKLGELNPQKYAFRDETSQSWLKSIVNPNIELTSEQRVSLINKANDWINEHSQVSELRYSLLVTKEEQGDHNE